MTQHTRWFSALTGLLVVLLVTLSWPGASTASGRSAAQATMVTIIPSPTPYPSITPTPALKDAPHLVVNSLDDYAPFFEVNPTDGVCDAKQCTLREGVNNIGDGGLITFAPGLVGRIFLKRTLDLVRNVTIRGPGPKSSAITLDLTLAGGGPGIFVYAPTDEKGTVLKPVTVHLDLLTIDSGEVTLRAGQSPVMALPKTAIVAVAGTTVNLTNMTFKNSVTEMEIPPPLGINSGASLNVKGSTFIGFEQVIHNEGRVEMSNSTIDNRDGKGWVGPILNSGEVILSNVTLRNNFRNAMATVGTGRTVLRNTIMVNLNPANTPICAGTFTDEGGNLIFPAANPAPWERRGAPPQPHNCHLVPSADPRLGPLNDNGGPTLTIAIGANSAAINNGRTAFCPAADQRGASLASAGSCDSGAFQRSARLQ